MACGEENSFRLALLAKAKVVWKARTAPVALVGPANTGTSTMSPVDFKPLCSSADERGGRKQLRLIEQVDDVGEMAAPCCPPLLP